MPSRSAFSARKWILAGFRLVWAVAGLAAEPPPLCAKLRPDWEIKFQRAPPSVLP